MSTDLSSHAKITWCPGCPNNAILVAFKNAITELAESGVVKYENVVATAGIGCHAKILDYLNMNTYNSLHGRAIPAAWGMKAANPDLSVFVFSGDGDSYSEGLNHLLHAARRNDDINVMIHNNQVFALTTGQSTATSPKGHKGMSRPTGSVEEPIDPIRLLLSAGATFVARSYAGEIKRTKEIIKAAHAHKGFSFIDIIQPCITFFDTRDFYKDRLEWLPDGHDRGNLQAALSATHRDDGKIPVGIFYSTERQTFEEAIRP
jgi:2-oxoglutarate ferredoxin oxidoreductase subunit beta